MKISSDDQKAISLILICLGFLFFLIGLAAHFKAGFQSRAEISTTGFVEGRNVCHPERSISPCAKCEVEGRPSGVEARMKAAISGSRLRALCALRSSVVRLAFAERTPLTMT